MNTHLETETVDKSAIRQRYDHYAPWYDLLLAVPECLFFSWVRRRLLRRASGRTLEVGFGTGRNLKFYALDCDVTAVDLSQHMLEIGRRRAQRMSRSAAALVMDGENLAFRDQSFDTVVDSFNLCTFPDPIAALREMKRVCRPDGRILLFEHGRSTFRCAARLQDRTVEWHAGFVGCHWNRDPVSLLRQAGLEPVTIRRTLFGIFYEIEARPLDSAP